MSREGEALKKALAEKHGPPDDGALDYVGRKACGCVVSWISTQYSDRREIADFIAKLARAGYSVERMTTEASRKALTLCEHGKPPKQEELALATSPRSASCSVEDTSA